MRKRLSLVSLAEVVTFGSRLSCAGRGSMAEPPFDVEHGLQEIEQPWPDLQTPDQAQSERQVTNPPCQPQKAPLKGSAKKEFDCTGHSSMRNLEEMWAKNLRNSQTLFRKGWVILPHVILTWSHKTSQLSPSGAVLWLFPEVPAKAHLRWRSRLVILVQRRSAPDLTRSNTCRHGPRVRAAPWGRYVPPA
jgi:hypothetical protein